MEIKTLLDLIEWSRELHRNLAVCMAHCASRHSDERASLLLDYLASHEAELEKMITAFGDKIEQRVLRTYVYDYVPHTAVTTHLDCDNHYATTAFDEIREEVFEFHEQIIELYQTLIAKVEIPQAIDMVTSLQVMEEQETKRLVRQVARMDDM